VCTCIYIYIYIVYVCIYIYTCIHEYIYMYLYMYTHRFDGDVQPDLRQRELDRFKYDEKCRVILMSVSTGGTGSTLYLSFFWFLSRSPWLSV